MLDNKFTIEVDFDDVFPCVMAILKDDLDVVNMEVEMVEQMDRGLVKFVDKNKYLEFLRKVSEAFETIIDYYQEAEGKDDFDDFDDFDPKSKFFVDKDE